MLANRWAFRTGKVLLVAFSLFFFESAIAGNIRKWERVFIPGAVCGDGLPYNVFVSPGKPNKVAFDLMGGGACWDFDTCYGLNALTWLHPMPTVLEFDGFVSKDPEKSPVADYTMVFFPYCTGDVHIGDHVAEYGPKVTGPITKVHHRGKRNFELAIEALSQKGVIRFEQVEDFAIMGYSAGAIGALFHSLTLDRYLTHARNKVLISDAPGLHFGRRFWEKFSSALVNDFRNAATRLGFPIATDQGNLAGLVPTICSLLPGWRIGVLQGARDHVMSEMFGSISVKEHEQLIYGPTGMFQLTADPNDHCSAWIPRTDMHTFLVTSLTASIETSDRVSAMEYARELIEGRGVSNRR